MASATVVSASGTNQTLALTKIDCGKLAEWCAKSGCVQLGLNPAIIGVLKAIASTTETTDLATRTA